MNRTEQIERAKSLIKIIAGIPGDDCLRHARSYATAAQELDRDVHNVVQAHLSPHPVDDKRSKLTSVQRDAALQLLQAFSHITNGCGYATMNLSGNSSRTTAPFDNDGLYMIRIQRDYDRFNEALKREKLCRSTVISFVVEGISAGVLDKATGRRNGTSMHIIKRALDSFAEIRGLKCKSNNNKHRYIGEMK